MLSHRRYFLLLASIFLIVFAWLAIEPRYRHDWALENLLVLVFAVLMVLSYRSFPLSRISYTLIFMFMLLHQIGAHYTYAEVPYDDFLQSSFGFSLNQAMGWERNHFDRLVHFLYGLLLAYPIREMFCRIADVKGFWAYFFPLDLTMATSMIFELFEWGAAELFGGDLGAAYLGSQGDIWDAHKDMGLAALGALLAMLITLLINLRIQRNLAAEWRESIRIKHPAPLGEDEIARLLEEKESE